jgi:hypothetical protein
VKIIENLVPLSNYHLGPAPDDICQRIDAAIAGAWIAIAPHFDAKIDLIRDDHVAGFVIGGRVLNVPFIGATLRSCNRRIAFDCSTDPNAKIVLSSDTQRSRQILMDKLSLEKFLTSDSATATKDETRQAYMRGAVKTVREMEQIDPSIGGIIRYGVISNGPVPYHAGICPEFS